jgi:hypothetical protein
MANSNNGSICQYVHQIEESHWKLCNIKYMLTYEILRPVVWRLITKSLGECMCRRFTVKDAALYYKCCG